MENMGKIRESIIGLEENDSNNKCLLVYASFFILSVNETYRT